MNHVRPLTDGFINQRVFNIENEKKINKALQDKYIINATHSY